MSVSRILIGHSVTFFGYFSVECTASQKYQSPGHAEGKCIIDYVHQSSISEEKLNIFFLRWRENSLSVCLFDPWWRTREKCCLQCYCRPRRQTCQEKWSISSVTNCLLAEQFLSEVPFPTDLKQHKRLRMLECSHRKDLMGYINFTSF